MKLIELKALALFAGKQDVRYYLNGVYLAPNGDAVATDGSMLLLKRNAHAYTDGIIIPSDAIAALCKIVGVKAQENGDFECVAPTAPDNKDWLLRCAGQAVSFRPIDGVYPDYARILTKKPDTVAHGHLDSRRLATFQKAAELACGKNAIAIYWPNGMERAAFIEFCYSKPKDARDCDVCDGWEGTLMPWQTRYTR